MCGETAYEVLDAHRIVPGSVGGKYRRENLVALCCVCHRKVHAGLLTIHRRYDSTAGPVLHVTEGDKSFFLFEESGRREYL